MAAYWLADWALRLNNKTVTPQVGPQRWRVAYSLLHRVVESGASHGDPAELGVADSRVETMRGSFGDGVRRLQLASRRVTSADSCWMAPVGKDQPSVAAFRQSFQWLLHIEHCRRAAPVGHDERCRGRCGRFWVCSASVVNSRPVDFHRHRHEPATFHSAG
jgi:hypothetical protein